jgi:hypothetical protein
MQKDSVLLEVPKASPVVWEPEGVCFDPTNATLCGFYADEISAHRAKRLWGNTLELHFLLDTNIDFDVKVKRTISDPSEDSDNTDGTLKFQLTCSFKTACARYAFWRLTNHQAPEAQYLIETAHIPDCASRQLDILSVPDLRSVYSSGNIGRFYDSQSDYVGKITQWIRTLLKS